MGRAFVLRRRSMGQRSVLLRERHALHVSSRTATADVQVAIYFRGSTRGHNLYVAEKRRTQGVNAWLVGHAPSDLRPIASSTSAAASSSSPTNPSHDGLKQPMLNPCTCTSI